MRAVSTTRVLSTYRESFIFVAISSLSQRVYWGPRSGADEEPAFRIWLAQGWGLHGRLALRMKG